LHCPTHRKDDAHAFEFCEGEILGRCGGLEVFALSDINFVALPVCRLYVEKLIPDIGRM
jgi:hypothetical protein